MRRQGPRRLLLGVVMLSVASSGCGSGHSVAASGSTAARSIQHDGGSSKVPTDPKRVVTVDNSAASAALSLGVTPKGSTYFSSTSGTTKVAGIADVGLEESPNLEAIAALKPDLILGGWPSGLYDKLSAIAPTVEIGYDEQKGGLDWMRALELYARALGKESKASDLLAQYRAGVARAQRDWDLVSTKPTVSILRPGNGHVSQYLSGTFSGSIVYDDVGFAPPPTAPKVAWQRLSLEHLPDLDADHVVVWDYTSKPGNESKDAAGMSALLGNPLWERMTGTKVGHLIRGSNAWYGMSYTSAMQLLKELDDAAPRGPR